MSVTTLQDDAKHRLAASHGRDTWEAVAVAVLVDLYHLASAEDLNMDEIVREARRQCREWSL